MRRLGGVVLAAGIVLLGAAVFDVPPAAACSCAPGAGDRDAFERADVVFVGEVSALERSSVSGARWTFRVSRVYKGDVAERQPIVSAFSGALCGLEIPERGEFLVFANGGAGPGSGLGAGEHSANLCGGTRSTSEGPLDASLASPRPPEGAQVARSTEARVDGSSSSAVDTTWLVGAAVFVVSGLGVVLATFWRRHRVRT